MLYTKPRKKEVASCVQKVFDAQEVDEERALLRYRWREGDRYAVIPALRRRIRKQREVAQLLQSSIHKIWPQFKNVERSFLMRNPMRAEQVQREDYWGESDIGEKPRARLDNTGPSDRVGMVEAEMTFNL
ncbi:uncharacterized protein Z519_08722 [Cladophialophora bantiana CBS 173.52]|uniref:Uncharacterized protein n=1 Tax=Cladophialophora bantiana (strain ATCC 10958 / CBS 173.52 / CDC B-1940 / NIH 8579) TaxID=1442370 RepID=A0A0D2I240_CLAB1|nr:uncharacterized protein Z519_08722 [Cladophialophora bantiana CBS 173.52]KIW90939.1 hypothetical protein Z519_08722 [Cladophialophora bantiana CBS 173.52]